MEYLRYVCCAPMGTSAVKGNFTVLQANNTRWSNMSCEVCNSKFNLFRHKKTCRDCGHNFCISCIRKMKGIEKPLQCHRCIILRAVPLNREAVMGLRVRDLRWFLESNKVPIHGCKEKQELVDLVIHHATLRNAASAYPQNYEKHTVRPEAEVPIVEDVLPNVPSHEATRTGLFTRQSFSEHASAPAVDVTTEVQVHESEDDGFTVFSLPTGRDNREENIDDEDNEEDIEEVIPMDLDRRQEEAMDCRDFSRPGSTENVLAGEQSPKPVSINNITCKEQILDLSVMELKLILARNFVSFKGCCEKKDLQDKVIQLWEQKQGSKDIGNMTDENLCKICFEAPVDSVLLDCGHVVTCTQCGKQLHECPICRQYVVRVVHIFKA